MSSYKPPFARRLGRHKGNKPAPRTAKNPVNFSRDPYAEPGKAKANANVNTNANTNANNVTEALEAFGVEEVVETVEAAETVEAVEAVAVETVGEPIETVEIEISETFTMKNTKAELLDAAAALGVDVSDTMNKTAILTAINEVS